MTTSPEATGGTAVEYMTVREAARRWNVTERLVQRLCAEGRVDGAVKFGRSWGIPTVARKPEDPRRAAASPEVSWRPRRLPGDHANLMPLMNTPFEPGHAREFVESLDVGPRADIARAELAYFSGRADEAAGLAEAHLESEDFEIRLSACLICAYANLPLGRIDLSRRALDAARSALARASEESPQLRAAESFISQAASVLLHLPSPADAPGAQEVMPLLPMGLRAFAFYVQAHAFYLAGDYAHSLGIAETLLTGMEEVYPIPFIYLHLVAVMDLMSLRRTEEAREHLLAAWELARPDDLIEGFGEHHGLLGGMLEAVIKPAWPEDFKRIIAITYRFSAGWRSVHNPAMGDDVADNLTATEFAASMLAARGWTNAEIARHMGVSPNTVKSYISSSLQKLGITRRQDLGRFMLA